MLIFLIYILYTFVAELWQYLCLRIMLSSYCLCLSLTSELVVDTWALLKCRSLCCAGDVWQLLFIRRAAVPAIHRRPDGRSAGREADGAQLPGWDVAESLSTDRQPFAWQWTLQPSAVGVVVQLSSGQRRVNDRRSAQSSFRVAAACCSHQKAPARVRNISPVCLLLYSINSTAVCRGVASH